MKGRKIGTSAGIAGAALLGFGALSGSALAETVKYHATLSAGAEVPATTSKGSGTAKMKYDPATKKLSWTVTYKDLSGPATMSHFHGPAEAGKNAPVEVAIPVSPSPMKGSATLTDAQAADLAAGKLYVNIHTAANKAGEIRGQVMKK
jgi:hypothetical protein